MKPYERREQNAYPYFKLAAWDDLNCTWKDGKRTYPSEAAAKSEARKPGRYRLSRVDESGRTDLPPFSKE